LVPNYPYLKYYILKSKSTISNADVKIDTKKTLIGDIAYLNAIINRSEKENTNKEIPPPETQSNTSQLVFINISNSCLFKIYETDNYYPDFIDSHINQFYLKIPSPPPQFIS
jgi:hypothetical protein